MPTVTITLTDTDDSKSIDCTCSLDLRAGEKLSLAQLAAAEIMLRTRREWNLKSQAAGVITNPTTTKL
jgi:hypothetical protein